MTRTKIKKKLKAVSGKKQRVYTDTRSIKEDSASIKLHPATLNPPNKALNQGIHNCSQ